MEKREGERSENDVGQNSTVKPELSIVVPTHGRGRQLERLLLSIDHSIKPDHTEVFVVSNLDDANVRAICAKFNFAQYLFVGSVGVNKARNLGLNRARGEVIIFLDDDCVVLSREFFIKHLSAHAANPKAMAIGGAYEVEGVATRWGNVYHQIALSWVSEIAERDGTTWSLLGGNVSIKRHMLAKGGLKFDPSIEFGGAETEFMLRLARRGHRLVFDRQLTLGHEVNLSFREFIKKAILQGVGEGRRQTRRQTPPYGSKIVSLQKTDAVYELAFDMGRRMGLTGVRTLRWPMVTKAALEVLGDRLFAWRRGRRLTRWVTLLRMALENRAWVREQTQR